MGEGSNAFKSRKCLGFNMEGRFEVRPSSTAIGGRSDLGTPDGTKVGYIEGALKED